MKNTTVLERSISIRRDDPFWEELLKILISLEDPFWEELSEIADLMNMPLERLVEQIDEGRSGSDLSSAIRVFVLTYLQMELHEKQSTIQPEDAESRLIT